MKFDPRRIEWVSVVLGLCITATFGQFLWLDFDFYLHSRVVLGEVVKLNHGGYHPQIAFTTNSGEQVSFPGSSTYPVEVGDRLEVRYLTSSPQTQPRTNQMWNLFDFMPTLFGIGVVIAGLCGKLVFFGMNGNDVSKK